MNILGTQSITETMTPLEGARRCGLDMGNPMRKTGQKLLPVLYMLKCQDPGDIFFVEIRKGRLIITISM